MVSIKHGTISKEAVYQFGTNDVLVKKTLCLIRTGTRKNGFIRKPSKQ